MSKHTHIPAKSSFIAKVDWQSEGMAKIGTLQITMHNTKTFKYRDVPLSVYLDMASAESCGQFFGRHVKGQFETIDEEQANV